MAIRYSEALGILKQAAFELLEREDGRYIEQIPLEDAIGRTAEMDHVSPTAAPPFDISAVDGYAISSAATANASRKRPVTFIVRGSIPAGGGQSAVALRGGSGIPSCFEIAAGAHLPEHSIIGEEFDACVGFEDVIPTVIGSDKMITVTEPISKHANKRFAGSDFKDGHRILEEGEKIQTRHIFALASAGITTVAVRRRARIAIWTIEPESPSHTSQTRSQLMNTNRLFLTASLRELSVETESKCALKSDADGLSEALQQIQHGGYDAVLTVGAISKGRNDLLAPALKAMGARLRFQGVAIQPGQGVLFATLPSDRGEIPIIGLPEDPMGVAACLQFLATPLVKQFIALRHDAPKIVRLQARDGSQNLSTLCPPEADCFRHGWIQKSARGEEVAILSTDQDPAKVSHFAVSNCWVHIPRGHSGSYRGTFVYCYPHSAGTCT